VPAPYTLPGCRPGVPTDSNKSGGRALRTTTAGPRSGPSIPAGAAGHPPASDARTPRCQTHEGARPPSGRPRLHKAHPSHHQGTAHVRLAREVGEGTGVREHTPPQTPPPVQPPPTPTAPPPTRAGKACRVPGGQGGEAGRSPLWGGRAGLRKTTAGPRSGPPSSRNAARLPFSPNREKGPGDEGPHGARCPFLFLGLQSRKG